MNGDDLMKQIIPFVKDIEFDTKISEITSISLEHNLNIENNDTICGNFVVAGNYKINAISSNEESFEKNLDIDIALNNCYDTSKIKTEIDNFYYEIIDEEILRIHIDVLLDNLILDNSKRCIEDNDVITPIPEKVESPIIEEVKENITYDDKSETLTNDFAISDISNNIISVEDGYCTYKVHIIRGDETINTIKELYNISQEELEKYNNIDKVVEGTKLIIPIINE